MASERETKAQKVRDESSLGSRSMFATSSHSTPLPNRRPVPGAESKTILTQEELDSLPRFRGEEQPVTKWDGLQRHWEVMADDERMQKAEGVLGKITERLDTGDGVASGYESGASVWLKKGSQLAGDGISALEQGYREQHPGLTP